MYIKRDDQSKITAISVIPEPGFDEVVDNNASELIAFLSSNAQIVHPRSENANESFAKSDEEFIRVLEDLINLLTEKGLIQFTELPSKAQEKLLRRQNIRAKNTQLQLVDDEDEPMLDLP